MNRKLNKDLNAIRREARSMLETVESVRGKQYGEVVRLLLNIKQAVHLTSMVTENMVELVEDDGQREAVVSARDVMADLLAQVAHSVFRIGGIEEAMWQEAIKDCDSLMSSVHGLIDQAMYADRQGGKFGDADAR